jgi:very-short-patch-repair endonuclease
MTNLTAFPLPLSLLRRGICLREVKSMGIHFNRSQEKEKRRQLRRDQTPAETLVWRYLRNRLSKNCKFRRQYSVDRYIIDFYSPEIKLAIEIDGDVHDLPEQKEHDKIRQKYLEEYGIIFLRIRNEELFGNTNKAFEKIEEAIMGLTRPMKPGTLS